MKSIKIDGKRYVLAASTQEGVKWNVKKFKSKRYPKDAKKPALSALQSTQAENRGNDTSKL